MSNLVFIEDIIINKDKIIYVDIYEKLNDTYKVNDIINLKITSNDFYFFRKDNDYLLAEYNEPHKICHRKIIGTLYPKEVVFYMHIDTNLCSNEDLQYKYPDVFDFYKHVCDCVFNEKFYLVGEYINKNFKETVEYGARIYMDTTPVKEIELEPKYSSKEEILNYFK